MAISMSAKEFIGLAAVMDTSQFDAGMKSYLDGIKQMESQTDKAAGEVQKSTEDMGKRQAEALKKVGIAFAAVGAAGTALLTSMALTASRAEELGIILDVTAENAQRLALSSSAAAAAAGD